MTKHIIACSIVLFLWTFATEGQVFRPSADAGVFAGVAYCLGDINPRKQFYDPGLAAGALVKYNLTEHHCLRINFFYGQLKGNDLDFKNEYQQMRGESFETCLIDMHAGWEFNFLPYIINRRKTSHTPYLFAAVGYSIILSSTAGMAESHATVPFGVGYKYRVSENIAIGCEWGMRKTFTDKIDGIQNSGTDGSYSKLHNNDWYSFAGVFVTFKIFEQGYACPGIKDQTTHK